MPNQIILPCLQQLYLERKIKNCLFLNLPWFLFKLFSLKNNLFQLLFMFTSFAKFPVFQSLLFEKACLGSGRFDQITCQNVSATHADLELQKEANHLLVRREIFFDNI